MVVPSIENETRDCERVGAEDGATRGMEATTPPFAARAGVPRHASVEGRHKRDRSVGLHSSMSKEGGRLSGGISNLVSRTRICMSHSKWIALGIWEAFVPRLGTLASRPPSCLLARAC